MKNTDMPNHIPDQQNSASFQELVAASSQVYSKGQFYSLIQTVLTIVSAVGGPLFSHIFPGTDAWVALVGMFILILNATILGPLSRSCKELGARIQELFDTGLYRLQWNSLKVGATPDHEVVNELSRGYLRKNPNPEHLRDWYPVSVGSIPLEFARIVCQRSNLRWDSKLRNSYCHILLVSISLVIPILGISYGIFWNLTLSQTLLSVFVPMLPAAIRLWEHSVSHHQTAVESERCKEHLETLWSRVINGSISLEETAFETRQLQDEIFERRKSALSVPQIVYRFSRANLESGMQAAAEKMITEALRLTHDNSQTP